MNKKVNLIIYFLMSIFLVGCTESVDESSKTDDSQKVVEETAKTTETEKNVDEDVPTEIEEKTSIEIEEPENQLFDGYKLIEVDGGDLSGHREPNVVVNIGFGKREYWAFTNEYGQLVRVIADKIILQDDKNEPVLSNGRYYEDEAKVPGVESEDLDEGHIIADSLGGVSNAYNITPQNSTLNRYGDQAYMEKIIRQAGGATNFEAIITYPNTKTQIPSHYQYTYYINGEKIVDSFDNKDPEIANQSKTVTNKNASKNSNRSNTTSSTNTTNRSNNTNSKDISSIDTNGDGQVTIKEAKTAGFKMPITRDHWLYKYMDDRDGDGMVGE